jgi:hypothetical protein
MGSPVLVGAPAPLLGLNDAGPWTTTPVGLESETCSSSISMASSTPSARASASRRCRLRQTLVGCSDPGRAVRAIDAALTAFTRGPQRDDTAVLAVQSV